jgi:ABC-2 type transport system ATP-binding protein
VRTATPEPLRAALTAHGGTVDQAADGALVVTGLDAATVGDLAAAMGIGLHELTTQQASLETAFMALTRDAVDFRPDEVH